MRAFLDVMFPKSNKSPSRQGLGCALTQSVAMLSLFSTWLLQSVWFCSLHPQHYGHCWLESASSGAQRGAQGYEPCCGHHTNLVGVRTSTQVRAGDNECFSIRSLGMLGFREKGISSKVALFCSCFASAPSLVSKSLALSQAFATPHGHG